ncbi:hypothetical protein GGI07_003307 [Coemansia sp. Benny D115]|nr:hypothetical protein GGI07_003307 [Coemansia sp. Benny D115]
MSSVERPAIDKLVPERWGIETKKLVLIPPEADQDMAVSKLLSDPETMKYLSFMTKPGGFTQEDAAKRRLYRDEGQIRDKIFVNFSIALKKSQIPPEIQEKILSEEYLPAKQIAIDGGIRKEVLYLGNDTYIDSWDYAIFDRDWSSHVKQRLCARIEKK